MKRQRTLAIIETYPKVRKFLNSISRNNVRTARIYNYALEHFQTFLEKQKQYKNYNIETVLGVIKQNKIDVYDLLDDFVGYLTQRQDASNDNTLLSPNTIRLYFAGVESYLADNDIEISKRKLKRRVRLPRRYKGIKEPINVQDIRDILLACTHDTLKAFILVLASSGMRSIEALSLRNSDVNFSTVPTTIHIRAQISKTNQENFIYISDEATKVLKKFIDSKYNNQPNEFKEYPNHLVFSKEINNKSIDPINIYRMLHGHFVKLLEKVEKNKRRGGQPTQRREISFHLFRTFVYTTISNMGKTSFAEWLLSHGKSVYWESKEPERRKIYEDCMKYLTFLDYSVLEASAKNTEEQLKQQEKEIEDLRDDTVNYYSTISNLEQQVSALRQKEDKYNVKLRKVMNELRYITEYIGSAAKSGAQLDVTNVPKHIIDNFKKTLSEQDRKKFEEKMLEQKSKKKKKRSHS